MKWNKAFDSWKSINFNLILFLKHICWKISFYNFEKEKEVKEEDEEEKAKELYGYLQVYM